MIRRKFCLLLVLLTLALESKAITADCSSLWEPLTPLRFSEEDQRILRSRHGALKDFIYLEAKVRRFLDQAPESAFAAIGAAFPLYFEPPDDSDFWKPTMLRYGKNFETIFQRDGILDLSRALLSDEDWEKLWILYTDQDLYDFLLQALTRLPAGRVQPNGKTQMREIQMRLRSFLFKHQRDLPSVEAMLAGSKLLRHSFSEAAKLRGFRFGQSLDQPRQQKAAAERLRNKTFGPVTRFLFDWFLQAIIRYHRVTLASGLEGTLYTLDENYIQENDYVELLNRVWLEEEISDYTMRPFVFALTRVPKYVNPVHSGRAVRNSIVEALKEHHDLVVQMWHEGEQETERPIIAPATVFRRSSGAKTELDGDYLDLYANGVKPIESLRAHHDYWTIFARDFGYGPVRRTIRFTQRALGQMMDLRFSDRVAPHRWLSAIRMGPAATYGNQGIKLIKNSPVPGMSHFSVEVKVLETSWRLLGTRDPTGRFVFDLLYDPH